MKILKMLSVSAVVLLALALGFQVGMTYESRKYAEDIAHLEELFSVSSGSGQVVEGDPEQKVDISLMWSVWRLLQKYYIEPQKLDTSNMVFGAVGGMVQGVGDPYTVFMTPKDTKVFDDALSGTLEGIGAQLDQQEGKVIVVAPIKGSPADKAGLLPKDEITKVDGKDVKGLQLDEIVTHIRGAKGTPVVLTILRPGKTTTMDITVIRDAIHIPSVESKVVETAKGKVGVVILNQFGDESIVEVKRAIEALPKDMIAIILDLRYNGGGYLDGATELVSMFVREGKVVSVVRRGTEIEEHVASGNPIVPTLPMAVLINGGSASASEITAGALKDLGRATLVGTQSFGKGTVQEIIDLPGGSSLRVTVAKWLTPSGHDLATKGIAPDIMVNRTDDEYRSGKDPQLDAAVLWLTEGKDVSKGTTSSSSSK